MIEVSFWHIDKPTEEKELTHSELKQLLAKIVSCVKVEVSKYITDPSRIHGLIFRLDDGRYLSLGEENIPSWECSSEGWITVTVYDEGWFKRKV